MRNYKAMVLRLVKDRMPIDRAITLVSMAYALSASQVDDLRFEVRGV